MKKLPKSDPENWTFKFLPKKEWEEKNSPIFSVCPIGDDDYDQSAEPHLKLHRFQGVREIFECHYQLRGGSVEEVRQIMESVGINESSSRKSK